MRLLLRMGVTLLVIVVLLAGAGWLGLQVRASAFSDLPQGPEPRSVPLPEGLPGPVERFARAVYGETIPVVETAMVQGRASLAPTGMPMPTRFRFYYDATRSSHYHDIQVTWFTLPFMRIHERNLEGHATLDLSILGRVDDQPHTNRASVQGYWAEVLAWVPAITLTDTRVRWEPVDEQMARLVLPELDAVEALTVTFDPDTRLIAGVETMRYQDESRPERWHWRNRVMEWGAVGGWQTGVRSQTQWQDNPPWALWEVEQVVFNVAVADRLAQFGGDV